MATNIETKPRAQDLFDQLNPQMYRDAAARGMGLSAYLEELSGHDSAEYKDGLDAYQRMLKMADIKTRSIPEQGIVADTMEKFMETDEGRMLGPEFFVRTYRGVKSARANRAPIYTSVDYGAGTIMRPYADAAGLRPSERLAPAIPLSEIVALETSIDSDSYRAFYLENNTDQQHMARVAEGTEVPRVKLVGGQHVINLKKYGRALEATYEQLRRMRLDTMAFHLERLAIQAETDKVVDAMNVLINGDGNSGTAAEVINASTLDAASTGGALTLQAWIRYKMAFKNPYMLTTALAQEPTVLKAMLLNTGSANIPLVTLQGALGFGSITPINRGLADGVRMGWLDDAPSLKIVGFDKRLALEHVTETGANITEIDKWITRQVEVMVMTEVEGWAIFDSNATKILNLA